MNTEAVAGTRIGQAFIRFMAVVMESRLRYRFFGPRPILQGADIQPGQTVLEVGCGTGFFTVPLAHLLGEDGYLVAMDMLAGSVKAVSDKVRAANLENVCVIRGDALDTGLDTESFDAVLVFGVIPAPMLPLERLLREMRRILKPGGTLSVWPTTWVHRSILQSGLFAYTGKRNNVSNYRR